MGDEDLMNGFKEVISEEVKSYGLSRIAKIGSHNRSSCPNDGVPSVQEYLSAINVYGITLVTLGAVAVFIILLMFIDTLLYIMRNSPPRVKAHSAFVIGVYPVVALATFCASIVPRSHLLAEAVTQGIFMAGMYQLFCLLVAYCGGEAELIRKVKPASLNTKVGPCCCWPCCCCLPLLDLNKNRVRYMRLLVLQLPVVQGLVYMTLLVMWAERESLYQINYMYVQPLVILSILFGIWAMSMTLHLLKDVLKGHSTPSKFFVLQMVLIFGKMQGLTMRIIVWAGVLPCHPPITPAVYGNLIYNFLTLMEMVLLGFIARKLYKRPLPEIDGPPGSTNNVAQVCVVSNRITTIGTIMANESNNNNNIFISDMNKQDASTNNNTAHSNDLNSTEETIKVRF